MTHIYSTLDDSFVRNLEFNVDIDSTPISSNDRMDSVPDALAALLTAQTENSYFTNRYNPSIINNELKSVFPFLSHITYKVTPVNSFFDDLKNKNNVNYKKSYFNTFAPIAVRYTNGTNLWLVERPPFQANITYRPAGSGSVNSKQQSYSIWMPWTVMLIDMQPDKSFYDSYLFFNDGPINSLDDRAIPCFFPNMYGDGRMCLNQSGVMLQQHLANTNSFDISTVYNFLINDYMSGGWNLDLGIQNFDRFRNATQLMKNSWNTITHGVSEDKKYPSCISPRTGRIMHKRYIPNFLNYFSLSPMNTIIDLISSLKDSKNSSLQSYASLIESHTNKDKKASSLLSNTNTPSSSVLQYFKLLVSPTFASREVRYNDPSTDYVKIGKNIITVLDTYLQEKLQTISFTNQHITLQDFETENPILYIEDEDNVFFLEENLSEEYFINLLNLKEKVRL